MKRISIIFVMLLLPWIIISACSQKTDEIPATQLQIVEHTMSFHNFGDALKSLVAIDGKARNTGSTAINTAVITVNFYDKDKNLLNTASAVKNNLAPGELWYFNVRFVGADAWKTTRYDISATVK